MGHVLELTDDEYTRLEAYARERGRTPHQLVTEWLASVSAPSESRKPAERAEQEEVPPPTEEELREQPILRVAGMLSVGIPGWADRHDEAFADDAMDPHADED